MRPRLLLVVSLLLVAAACADDPSIPTAGSSTTIDAAGLSDAVEQLVVSAEEVRGLEFVVAPEVAIVTAEELAERVREQIEEDLDPDEIMAFQSLYELLGLLDGSIDLGQAYTDLYAEQVGGFYDSDTGELVIMGGAQLTPLSMTIVVHELVHALTDQHFDFADQVDDLIDAEEFEQAAAIQALVEGDATYYQLIYLQSLPIDAQVAAVEESLAVETTVLDALPSWFGEDLVFPYDSGFGFVERLITEGGAAAVNQAYEHFPETTEQILHPEKYSIFEPALPVEIPDFDLAGYEVFEESTFGEWNARLLLLDGVGLGEVVVSSAGWGGDRYRLYWQNVPDCAAVGGCTVPVAFVYSYQGDSPRDATEFRDSLVTSVSRRMSVGSARSTEPGVTTFSGGGNFAWVSLDGEQVLFVAADDPSLGQALIAGITG